MLGSVRMPGGATALPTPVWRPVTPPDLTAGQSRRSDGVASADLTPPVTLFVGETVTRVSLVSGFTSTDVSWSADEDCQAWQIRDVTGAGGTTHSDGVLVASGAAIAANVTQVATIPSAALTAGDGSKTLKIFAQDLAGNWTP